MSRNKALTLYLQGAWGQIWTICVIVFLLRSSGMIVDYATPVRMVAIGIGGVCLYYGKPLAPLAVSARIPEIFFRRLHGTGRISLV